MVRAIDPEGVETRAIRELIDFAGKDVLEIGCGEGRMT
jgi:cyclopropane fatty-acyl-phospholipid synthase-like methyltransferase